MRPMKELARIWEGMGDIPINHDGVDPVLDEDWTLPDGTRFEAGTALEDVWFWFERQNPDFSVGYASEGRYRRLAEEAP